MTRCVRQNEIYSQWHWIVQAICHNIKKCVSCLLLFEQILWLCQRWQEKCLWNFMQRAMCLNRGIKISYSDWYANVLLSNATCDTLCGTHAKHTFLYAERKKSKKLIFLLSSVCVWHFICIHSENPGITLNSNEIGQSRHK